MSPWIRAKVVDRGFRARLEQLLKDGVHVCIAHGIDDGANAPEWTGRPRTHSNSWLLRTRT